MIKAIVIDDEYKSREVVASLVNQFIDGLEIVGGAPDIEGGISLITRVKPDLVFLDISLQDGDSFAILSKLPSIGFKIIFITAFDEYATQAIQFTRIPCLNKPLDIDELEAAVNKARLSEQLTVQEDASIILNILNSNFEIIPVMDVYKVTFVTYPQVVMLKRADHNTHMVMKKGDVLVSWYELDKYLNLLKNHGFGQVNEDVLVNLSMVESFPKAVHNSVELKNGDKLNFADDYKTDFIKRYTAFIDTNE